MGLAKYEKRGFAELLTTVAGVVDVAEYLQAVGHPPHRFVDSIFLRMLILRTGSNYHQTV
jgi:hypothetical protein